MVDTRDVGLLKRWLQFCVVLSRSLIVDEFGPLLPAMLSTRSEFLRTIEIKHGLASVSCQESTYRGRVIINNIDSTSEGIAGIKDRCVF